MNIVMARAAQSDRGAHFSGEEKIKALK